MTPDLWRRAGGAVAERITELGMTVPELARKAGVDPTTVRALIHGTRRLRVSTRDKIVDALGWTPEEFIVNVWVRPAALTAASSDDLISELYWRMVSGRKPPDVNTSHPIR